MKKRETMVEHEEEIRTREDKEKERKKLENAVGK